MVVCPLMHEMVVLLGSLSFTGMGPVNNSLMLDARKTFLGIFVFLFLVHMFFRSLHMLGFFEWHQEEARLSRLD